MKGTGRQLI